MSKDIENAESADSKTQIENDADHDYVVKRADRSSEQGEDEFCAEKNSCENLEIPDELDKDEDKSLQTHLHLQKALNQLITLVNTHPLGTSQRKQILKILPVFIEQNIKIFDEDPMPSCCGQSSQSADKLAKKSNVSPEIDELMNSIEQDFLSQISGQNQTNHNHKSKGGNTNLNEPTSSLDIEKHEEKIYQLDCALGIEKITSNMGKFEEMNKKFNALLEKQLPGQKKEFLKFFRKSSQLASALKQNKDFDDDK